MILWKQSYNLYREYPKIMKIIVVKRGRFGELIVLLPDNNAR